METIFLFYLLTFVASGLWAYRVFVSVPRAKMEARAAALEASHTFHERTSVYLPLRGTFSGTKQKQIDAKVAEMARQDWVYLQASSAGWKTLTSWGGGIHLHFARV